MPPKSSRKKMGKTGDLPPDILAQMERFLVEGVSYEEISAFLSTQGYEISKTAVGRYGKRFLESCRRLRVIVEKSRALASDDESGLLMGEASARLFGLTILEAQLSGKIGLARLPKLLSDFARLQSSNVQRERLRRELRKRVEKAAEEVEQSVRGGGLSDRAAEQIRRKILGIVE